MWGLLVLSLCFQSTFVRAVGLIIKPNPFVIGEAHQFAVTKDSGDPPITVTIRGPGVDRDFHFNDQQGSIPIPFTFTEPGSYTVQVAGNGGGVSVSTQSNFRVVASDGNGSNTENSSNPSTTLPDNPAPSDTADPDPTTAISSPTSATVISTSDISSSITVPSSTPTPSSSNLDGTLPVNSSNNPSPSQAQSSSSSSLLNTSSLSTSTSPTPTSTVPVVLSGANRPNGGIIAGAVIGTIMGILALLAAIFFYRRVKSRNRLLRDVEQAHPFVNEGTPSTASGAGPLQPSLPLLPSAALLEKKKADVPLSTQMPILSSSTESNQNSRAISDAQTGRQMQMQQQVTQLSRQLSSFTAAEASRISNQALREELNRLVELLQLQLQSDMLSVTENVARDENPPPPYRHRVSQPDLTGSASSLQEQGVQASSI